MGLQDSNRMKLFGTVLNFVIRRDLAGRALEGFMLPFAQGTVWGLRRRSCYWLQNAHTVVLVQTLAR